MHTLEQNDGVGEEKLITSFHSGVALAEQDIRVIEDIKTFDGEVTDFIRRWHQTTDQSNCYVGFDGLPGAGKTTLMESLRNICSRLGITLHENGVDNFITTDRDDPLREEMTRAAEIFKLRYYCRESVGKLMNVIHQMNGHGTTVHFDRMYDRSIGKVGPGSVKVPSGRKIVLLEGVNAIPFIHDLEKRHGASALKVHVFAKPRVAMERAISRDARNGSRKPEKAYALRAAEYKHLIGPVNERNPWMADIIYFQD